MDEEMPVIFRRYNQHGGIIFALFPDQPGTADWKTCTGYAHVGQHSSVCPWMVMRETKRAKPEEYADLKKELESGPYWYRLRVYKRLSRKFHDARKEALRG